MVDDNTNASVCIVSFQNPILQISNNPKTVNTPTPFPDYTKQEESAAQ